MKVAGWCIAGVGGEALAWVDRVRLLDPSAPVSVWDPDPERGRLVTGPQVSQVEDPAVWPATHTSEPPLFLVDAELTRTQEIVRHALAHGCGVALIGTASLSADDLRELATEARQRGLTLGLLSSHRNTEDFRLAEQWMQSGQPGPIRSARFVCRGSITAPAGSATPSASRIGRVLPTAFPNAWRIYDCALALGLTPLETRFDLAGDRAWFGVSRCDSGALLVVDYDERARRIEPPRWTLEGRHAAYSHACLRTTNADGEIVEVPLERPVILGDQPLREFVCQALERRPLTDELLRIARALDIAQKLGG